MMHTLNIENGAEVELKKDMSIYLHGSFLCFSFKIYDETVPRVFWLPVDFDELLAFLFDISLRKTIDHAFGHIDVSRGERYITGYEFALVDSEDHQTNITPEFIEAVSRFNDVMKKEDEEDGQH